ncbi:multidrug efflux SMR transporter [Paenibacillus anaericanus]|uniref:Multidrug efflux SMR transporter n=1 Tax=Paenibacillus anaericanus TaxID=170367 RepID=A0A433XYZ4_9BACL|nr:multidrug efflux SMR transporter [Paenibacillus anaericanus]RUT40322.1 multidrug efflux SMR transporter [Paenibacillus anaericanus]
MSGYLFLVFAIITDAFGSTMMKASNGFKKLYPTIAMVVGLVLSFLSLSMALKTMPLGAAYAIWSGACTALTVLVGVIVFKEKLNFYKGLGVLLIIAGVAVMKLVTD